MKLKIVLSILFTLALGIGLSVVALKHGKPSPVATAADTRTFEVHGTIRDIDTIEKRIRIAHEAIPDYMPAMTMPFAVKNTTVLKGLSTGDQVQFELSVTADDSWVSHIEKIASDSPTTAANPSLPLRDMELVQIGETVPDFSLVDQNGKEIHLLDFRGTAVVLTFIYTRCPLPNFCPLMSKNFAELQKRLTKEFPGRYHLLSITMDSEFDRPAVLKDYAMRYDADERFWIFATGSEEQINTVAGLLGLYFVRENGLISHDLRTALIGPNGKLLHIWKSNVWTPYEVQRMVGEALTGPKDAFTASARASDLDSNPRD